MFHNYFFMTNEPEDIAEITDGAVKDYAFEIVEKAKSYTEYKGEIDINFDPCTSADQKYTSNQATITSELGVIVVFPDFVKKSAAACVVNLGLINAMQMEGFDNDFIEQEGKVYGTLVPQNSDTVETFAYYLTHKIDPVAGR